MGSARNHFHWEQHCFCTVNGGSTCVLVHAEIAAVEHVVLDLALNTCPCHQLTPEKSCSKCLICGNFKGSILLSVTPQETCRKVPVFIMILQSDTRAGVSTDTWIRFLCLHLVWQSDGIAGWADNYFLFSGNLCMRCKPCVSHGESRKTKVKFSSLLKKMRFSYLGKIRVTKIWNGRLISELTGQFL